MVVPMTVAVWLIDGARRNRKAGVRATRVPPARCAAAFGVGWWWGFGYFVAGLWWLGAAFLVDADDFVWAMPLGVVGLPAVLALFPAFGFALARAVWPPAPRAHAGARRGLRLHRMAARQSSSPAFPGTNMAWRSADDLVAGARRRAGRPAWPDAPGDRDLRRAGDACGRPRGPRGVRRPTASRGARARRALPASAPVRLSLQPAAAATAGRRSCGSMQPNVAQGREFRAENKAEILGDYLKLSDRATRPSAPASPTSPHLIWPESAFPFILSRDPRRWPHRRVPCRAARRWSPARRASASKRADRNARASISTPSR